MATIRMVTITENGSSITFPTQEEADLYLKRKDEDPEFIQEMVDLVRKQEAEGK